MKFFFKVYLICLFFLYMFFEFFIIRYKELKKKDNYVLLYRYNLIEGGKSCVIEILQFIGKLLCVIEDKEEGRGV